MRLVVIYQGPVVIVAFNGTVKMSDSTPKTIVIFLL